jgi:hypothetical protein
VGIPFLIPQVPQVELVAGTGPTANQWASTFTVPGPEATQLISNYVAVSASGNFQSSNPMQYVVTATDANGNSYTGSASLTPNASSNNQSIPVTITVPATVATSNITSTLTITVTLSFGTHGPGTPPA